MLGICLGTFIFCEQPKLEVVEPKKVEIKELRDYGWEFEWVTVCRYGGDWYYNHDLDAYVLKCVNHSSDDKYDRKINMLKATYKF